MDLRAKIKEYSEIPISRHLILELLTDYKRPNDKIRELIKSKHLIHLRRGLYSIGPNLDLQAPEPYLIANHLRGPSYVSLDTALAYWNMIPERTFEISSVTLKSSKTFNTMAGRFTYKNLKSPYYSFGIKKVDISSKQTVLIASKEKALCDKIVLTPKINLRSINQTIDFLMLDLRIDREELNTLDTDLINLWASEAPKKSSLQILIKTLKKL